ncbi:substrate-binding periplasmic protein [Neptuniibacter sp. QD37_6]|uniref:substrate-binding periplasmic protein n=1 Tax=Neptuniibacter sp. QD37_6 TaxID=3398210 RepID=UPI0039F5AC15
MIKRFCILLIALTPILANACTLTMGYRTSERMPLIQKAPDNSGLYNDLYSKASSLIGCKLEVIRLQKKRILHAMQEGIIDFYPGFNFSLDRQPYTFYIQNGLTTSLKVISHIKSPEVNHIEDMRGHSMLAANGNPTFGAASHEITIRVIENLDLPRALEMLEQERADYYLYQSNTIRYYLKKYPNTKIKLHPCCSAEEPMYLGFSKLSPHYQRVDNPNYKSNLPLSINNDPDILIPDSLPHKLQEALKFLDDSGFIDQLEKKYYE